jgi:hypothetical protein
MISFSRRLARVSWFGLSPEILKKKGSQRAYYLNACPQKQK